MQKVGNGTANANWTSTLLQTCKDYSWETLPQAETHGTGICLTVDWSTEEQEETPHTTRSFHSSSISSSENRRKGQSLMSRPWTGGTIQSAQNKTEQAQTRTNKSTKLAGRLKLINREESIWLRGKSQHRLEEAINDCLQHRGVATLHEPSPRASIHAGNKG